LITQVTTTLATESDMAALENVHRTLQQKDLLPGEHLLDAGYVMPSRWFQPNGILRDDLLSGASEGELQKKAAEGLTWPVFRLIGRSRW